MSESENSSDDAALQIGRLTKLWEQMKEVTNHSLEQEKIHEINGQSIKEQKNLQTRLRITEGQLAKSKQNTALIMKKLSQAEDQIEFLKSQLKQQSKLAKTLQQKLSLTYSYKKQEDKKQKERERERQELQRKQKSYQESINASQQLQNLKKEVDTRQKKFKDMILIYKELQLENQKLNNRIQELTNQNQQLKNRLMELQQKLNEYYLQQENIGIDLLQMNQIKANIARLLYLLKQTDQFYNFVLCAQDSEGLHFLQNIIKRIKNNEIVNPPTFKAKRFNRFCTCMQIKMDQKYIWAPIDAYKIMSQIKGKYSQITQQCIQEILFQLNQIWSVREDAHIKRLKEFYEQGINILKKKNKVPFDQITAKKQISRLKKQITKVKYQKMEKNPIRSYQNLKINGQFEDQLRRKEKQIKILSEKINDLEGNTESFNQVLYLEGALWMINKMLAEVKIHKQQFNEFQQQFCFKLQKKGQNQQIDWMRLYKFFFQGIQEINNGLIQKVKLMQESTRVKIKNKRK